MSGGQTVVEKIVSRATKKKVRAGDLVQVLPIDKLYFNEVIAPPAILNFRDDFETSFPRSDFGLAKGTSYSQPRSQVEDEGVRSKKSVLHSQTTRFLRARSRSQRE